MQEELKEKGCYVGDLWDAKWTILKNIEDWTAMDHQIIELLLKRYSGTVIEDILILKQRIRDLFLDSGSSEEAHISRDALIEESWHLRNTHFSNIIKFLSKPYFKYMVTFMDHPELPKSGNSENVIRVWRQMEKVRYGFKSHKGKVDHLKLFQVTRYLGEGFK
ncbi:MAG: transposase [bacterium]